MDRINGAARLLGLLGDPDSCGAQQAEAGRGGAELQPRISVFRNCPVY